MQDRTTSGTSADYSVWIWIIGAGLLFLALVVSVAFLLFITGPEPGNAPAGTPAAPATAPAPPK